MQSKKFIPISSCDLNGNELAYLENCIKTNWISSLGEYVSSLELQFSQRIGTKYSASCSNGTIALHLALLSLDIKPGDEIIVPSFTFIATINAILYCGAKPVFVDIDPVTWCMDVNDIKRKINNKTKAIMMVHIYGNPADIYEISEIAKSNDLNVIEDCAEALGAKYDGKPVGSFGDISCFSFYGNKIITSGEGGMVSTNNPDLFDKIKMLRDQGMSQTKKYYHEILGYNYRFSNIQAAIALAQFEKIDIFIKRRKEIFELYLKLLNESFIQLPFKGDNIKDPVNWLFTILIKNIDRDDLIIYLKENNIDSRPTFYPCHKMPYINKKILLPVTEEISTSGISLPTYVNLSNSDIEYISELIKNKLNNLR